MAEIEKLKIPSRLLRNKPKSQKKFTVDKLSNDTVKYNSISVDFVFDFYDAFILGTRFPKVEIFELKQNVRNAMAGETGTINGKGEFCPAYGKAPFKVKKKLLRSKPREKWTTNEVVNFGILPEMRVLKGSQIIIDNTGEDKFVGEPFQGAFVSQARNCLFSELVEALKKHFSEIDDPRQRFIWLDIFCANQPHLCDQSSISEKEQKRINDLLAFGLHDAIENFDEVLVFFDDFNNPMAVQRAWCIWELYGMARNDLNFEIISSSKILQKMEENFLNGSLNVLNVLGLLNVEQMHCSNENDKIMIMQAVEGLPEGFSGLKRSLTDKFRKWILNFANRLLIKRLNKGIINENDPSIADGLWNVTDGECFRELAKLLWDFGEFDISLSFVQAASTIFKSVENKLLESECNSLFGDCYRRKHDDSSALKYYQLDLDFQLNSAPRINSKIARAYMNLGITYKNLSKFAKAEESYDMAVAFEAKSSGKKSAEVFKILVQKQNLLNFEKKYEEAVDLGEELLKMSQKTFRGDNALVAKFLNNLSNSYASLKEYNKALKLQLSSQKIRIEIFGSSHWEVGVGYTNLGNRYKELGDFISSESCYQKAKEVHEKNKDLVRLAKVLFYMGLLQRDQGRKGDAAHLLKEARKTFLKANWDDTAFLERFGCTWEQLESL